MTSYPSKRFVRMRHDDSRPVHATATFLGTEPQPPTGSSPGSSPAADHGVIAAIAADDPERASRVQAGLRHLISRNDAVMSWLEADPDNTALFTRDPEAALRQALPDLPSDFFDGWRAS